MSNEKVDNTMISKVTQNDFNESAGNRYLQAELEKNLRIKTYFKESDKTPNTDGYFEVLDYQGIAMKRFVVQIKTARKISQLRNGDYSYSADTAFLQYVLENIDQNPAVYFVIDLSKRILYYKYLSLEYILSLSIGHKKTVALHLNESDILDEEKFYDFCMELIRQKVVDDSRALTKVLLPDFDGLSHDERIDVTDVTRRYPMPVGAEESRMLRIPSSILEKYDDIRLLGVGGTSKVFRLTSKLTGSKVAMKVAPIKESSAKPLLHAFKIFDQLRHPTIPRVLDYLSDDETEYMIMDYIEGNTLKELTAPGAFNLAEIIVIFADICGSVQLLHANGLINRDLKPSNVMIGPSHSIKVIDFDMITGINEKHPRYSFIGTLKYAAPETFSPDYESKESSAIFSIGATLYYSLINKETRKFLKSYNSSFELCEYIANYTGDELGYGLEILKKALAFDPEKRYRSALNMQEDLMIWQKKEFLHPSVLNLALARSRKTYYKEIIHKKSRRGKK